LGFELRTGAETWFIGERRGGGDKSTKKRGFIQQVHQLADLTRVYGKFEIYSTDESGRLNSALKFLPLHDSCRKLLSVFGRGQSY
jgi:hypothetical protein